MMNNQNHVLNALSYFSVIFAPFLVPLIIWIIGKDDDVKHHAKRALLSHIIPTILVIIFIAFAIIGAVSGMLDSEGGGILFFIGFAVITLLYLIIFIWNIIQGIKVLKQG